MCVLTLKRFPAILFMPLIAFMFASCGSSDSNQSGRNSRQQSVAVARPATSGYEYLSAFDIDGSRRQFSEWVGKRPVVINLWGTWCPPCRKEIPDLIRLYEEYHPKGIEIIGVAVRDSPSRVRRFAANAGMEWVLLMAENRLLAGLGMTGSVPTTIFLDETGKELGRFVGLRDYDTFKKAFQLLAKQG